MHYKKGRMPYGLLLVAAIVLNLSLHAQPGNSNLLPADTKKGGIVFIENSWSAATKAAAETHKYIFVDAYASWCGPCKMLKATTFKNKEVADFFNQHFVNLSIDMEKGEGNSLSEKWQVQAYPTLIIFDAAGKPVLETAGFLKAKDLLRFAQQALGKKAE